MKSLLNMYLAAGLLAIGAQGFKAQAQEKGHFAQEKSEINALTNSENNPPSSRLFLNFVDKHKAEIAASLTVIAMATVIYRLFIANKAPSIIAERVTIDSTTKAMFKKLNELKAACEKELDKEYEKENA